MPLPLRRFEDDWGEQIKAAARGEQQALARLYDLSSRLIYSVVLRILGNPADAEEVTIDVYTQVWRNAGDYNPGRGSPSSWLTMMARSRALDRLRSQGPRERRERALEDVAEARSPIGSAEDAALMAERHERVRQAMAQLTAEQREAIELSYFAGLTHTELAQRLDQPLGTVKTRIRLGMIKLRESLGAGKEVQ